jgi:hypothetical protein
MREIHTHLQHLSRKLVYMGYTTKFTGQFTLSPLPMPAEVVLACYDLEGTDGRESNYEGPAKGHMPDSYLQWKLTKDRTALKWDGGEKFYEYEAWLQWLVDYVFTPEGITVSGQVEYSGDEVKDTGTLAVVDGQVIKTPAVFVDPQSLEELQAFRQFVLDSKHGDQLVRAWQTQQARKK